jgi:hypothetical protein
MFVTTYRMVDEPKSIRTPYGTFRPRFNDTVAISVVQINHTVFSKGKVRRRGDYSFVEHRGKLPKSMNDLYWARYVATYTPKGKRVIPGHWRQATRQDRLPRDLVTADG